MSRRPLGVTLLAVGLGVLGLAAVVTGLSMLATVAGSTIDPAAPAAAKTFLRWFPVLLAAWGVLDLVAAIGLWAVTPWGRTAGLAALGGWLLEELVVLVAGLTAWPAGTDLGVDPVAPVVRLGVVGALGYYLWRYEQPDRPRPAGDPARSAR